MQTVWSRLTDQIVCSHILSSIPIVLDLQLPQFLCAGQRGLESINTAIEVVLRLVENLLRLQDAQNLLLTIKDIFGKEVV